MYLMLYKVGKASKYKVYITMNVLLGIASMYYFFIFNKNKN